MTKWLGPAAWNKREARGGDRLPYARHIDASTLRLRDGSLMRSMRLAGFPLRFVPGDILRPRHRQQIAHLRRVDKQGGMQYELIP